MPPKESGSALTDVLIWDSKGNQLTRHIDTFSTSDAHISQFPLGKSFLVCAPKLL